MTKSILIIEDNTDIRESTAELLGLSGYKVRQAANGKAGVGMALEQRPDLILCDIMMPEMDGYGVLYLLSKNASTHTIPFIFLTAKSERQDFRRGMELGADDYLTKPFGDMELLGAIETRLNKVEKEKFFYTTSIDQLKFMEVHNESGSKALQLLVSSRKVRKIKKRQIIYFDGDSPLGIYVILKGLAKTFKLSDDGRELATGRYGCGDYLGVAALLSEEHFSETAEALEDTEVCLLQKEAVMELIDLYPDIGRQFVKVIAHNIREKEVQLLDIAYHSVRRRMARLLIQVSFQSTKEPKQISIPREELASSAGIATETVSRTLSDFRAEGIIEKKGSMIVILDSERLKNMKN